MEKFAKKIPKLPFIECLVKLNMGRAVKKIYSDRPLISRIITNCFLFVR
jgi:hypothetical protein